MLRMFLTSGSLSSSGGAGTRVALQALALRDLRPSSDVVRPAEQHDELVARDRHSSTADVDHASGNKVVPAFILLSPTSKVDQDVFNGWTLLAFIANKI